MPNQLIDPKTGNVLCEEGDIVQNDFNEKFEILQIENVNHLVTYKPKLGAFSMTMLSKSVIAFFDPNSLPKWKVISKPQGYSLAVGDTILDKINKTEGVITLIDNAAQTITIDWDMKGLTNNGTLVHPHHFIASGLSSGSLYLQKMTNPALLTRFEVKNDKLYDYGIEILAVGDEVLIKHNNTKNVVKEFDLSKCQINYPSGCHTFLQYSDGVVNQHFVRNKMQTISITAVAPYVAGNTLYDAKGIKVISVGEFFEHSGTKYEISKFESGSVHFITKTSTLIFKYGVALFIRLIIDGTYNLLSNKSQKINNNELDEAITKLYDHAYRVKELSPNDVSYYKSIYQSHKGKPEPEFMRK